MLLALAVDPFADVRPPVRISLQPFAFDGS
jgi:hypothetical protein